MDEENKSNRSMQKNSGIKINKSMRLWNKYKNYIISIGGFLIVIILVMLLLKGCQNGNTDEKTNGNSTSVTISNNEKAPSETNSSNTQTQATTQVTTQATTQANVGNKVYTTTKVLAKEEYKSSSFFENSAFLGDSFVTGISYYGYLPTNKVISKDNLTTDKAMDSMNELVATSPQKVFVMLGINDLNYGTRSVDNIVSNYATLIGEIKKRLPSTKIYILSVLPITKTLESKTNVYIKKVNLDELNNKLKAIVITSGVDYLDLASVFQNNTGYLNDTVTNNGLNISNDYYGFMLNTIADMLK